MEVEKIEPKQEQEFELDYNILEDYYRTQFPISQMYQWLSYPHNSEPDYFCKREFSFTLKDEIYLRYQMFNSDRDFRSALLQKIPEKIDIGAVYNKPGKKGDDIHAVEKEFVIDIDMTDYDNIRTCCSKAKICPKCWKFMQVACRLISQSLDDDFGFKQVLWVYSGRRGIHAWVCDKEIRKANDQARCSIIDYLNILIDNSQSSRYVKSSLLKMNTNFLVERNALKQITQDGTAKDRNSESDFINIVLRDQDLFMKKPQLIIEFLAKRNESLSQDIEQQWKNINTSEERFKLLKETVNEIQKGKNKAVPQSHIHYLLEELKIWLLYPRLDVNVSKSTNHLLKSPFCIHPKTGNVCVPFTTKEIDTFDPFTVPNISTLNTAEGKKRMEQCIKIFNDFLENLKSDV